VKSQEQSLTEDRCRTDDLSLARYSGPASGPPLLFLHGVVRCGWDFSPLFEALAGQWQIQALDLRGHGQSERAESYLVTDYSRDVAGYLRRHAEEPVVLCGHSLGAMVACAAAAAVPEKVRAVVLEDPPFHTLGRRIRETPFHALFRGMQAVALGNDQPVDVLARELAEIRLPTRDGRGEVRLGDLRDEEQLRWSAQCLQPLDPAVLTPVVEERWLDGYDLETLLPQVRCPALLLAADEAAGGMLTPADAETAAALLPQCTRVDFPGVGHQIHGTQPAAMLQAMLPFLETLDLNP